MEFIRVNMAENWVGALPKALQVMRFTKHRAHGQISFELLYELPAMWGPIQSGREVSNLLSRWNSTNNQAAVENHVTRTVGQKKGNETSWRWKWDTRYWFQIQSLKLKLTSLLLDHMKYGKCYRMEIYYWTMVLVYM
eukprot:NODE_133_length_16612_cov_1.402531.p8 type:complete len:137 gc:universal NODE_133_length_16612_cov_1.402531:16099-16509(+)